MKIENLNETDVTRLTKVLEELRQTNPAINYEVFTMGQDPRQVPDSIQVQLSQIQADLNQLKSRFDIHKHYVNRIFGEYVLINGRWTILK